MTPELKRLEQVNRDLENHNLLSRQDLLDMKIIQESQQAVHRVGVTDEEGGGAPRQSLPFSRLYLPFAFTGILEPNKSVTAVHRAINIVLPGTGTTFSVAQTLCDVAGTFHGKKSRNRGKARKSSTPISKYVLPGDDTFRAASFPADLPLNGMGSDAPFEFAGKAGLLAVIRHIHLVLSRLYPDRPVFLSGRSQGGIASILYGQHYADIAGIIAVNPPHPEPELFQFTIDYLESIIDDLANLLHTPGAGLHIRSWEAYKHFTPAFNYPDNRLRCPALILVSLGDPFNLFPQYAHSLKAFADGDELCQLELLDAGHNLWDRKSVDTYHTAIGLQTEFMLAQIKSMNAADQARGITA